MTPHTHSTLVDGCYRCELGRDEMEGAKWDAVYDVLVEHCGASELARPEFIQAQMRDDRPTEYRFCGSLGFGGKFWREPPGYVGERWRVTCYPEDETPERRAAIDTANDALIDIIHRSGLGHG